MEKIKLVVLNGTAYVWTVEDWMKIRQLRILGNFIGSLAVLPRQNHLAGFPLALLNEETTLLLEKDYALTKTILNLSGPPDEDTQNKNHKHLQKIFSEQAELMKQRRKQEIESKIDIILEGKKAKRGRSKEGKLLNRETVLEEELKKLTPIKSSALAVQIFTEDPWLEDKNYKDCLWYYPKDKTENLKYSVFKNLWERGYYITSGGKFGGDYLAYPGDPIKFHAFFIVNCIDKETKFRMDEIITYGRLAHSVRKTIVLAYLDENNEICYHSIQWSGF